MKNTKFVEECKALKLGETLKKEKLLFEEIFNLKYPEDLSNIFENNFTRYEHIWFDFHIYAHVKKNFVGNTWKGHNHQPEFVEYNIPKDSQVCVWMVSRFGDVGITGNIIDPTGYDLRTSPDNLYNWEIIRINEL